MKRLCVIGDPIEHSRSPLIQNAMIRAAGLDYVYDARRVAGTDTAQWLRQAGEEGYVGFNATMPHKENLVSLVDELCGDAALFRSVNTVSIRKGRVYGFNTDAEGFLQALRQAGMDPAGKAVLVLGAGGAAKAVVSKLLQAQAQRVTVANRTRERAQALCAQLGQPGLTVCGFAPDDLKRHAAHSRLVVNCTSLGMTGTAGQFEDFGFLDELGPDAGVYDLIYSPAQTELLEQAAGLGLKTSNGLGMLVWQGVYALEHFTQAGLDKSAMAAAAYRALEGLA
ncbi:MAG: shikimate dehydrogenase [Oscillospiraceae bacterium]|nr:shikimate dehydrogenase [Oscillospiraceae bacterium]